MSGRRRTLAILCGLAVLTAGCSSPVAGTGVESPGVAGTATGSPSSTTTAASQSPSPSTEPAPGALTPRSTAQSAPPPTTTPQPATPAPVTSPSPSPATDLDGDVYGFIRAVDPQTREITLDKIDYFTGAAAQQACAEDGVQSQGDNWCTGYYYRNVNPALRVVAVSPDATIVTLNGATEVPSDLVAVAARISGHGNTYHLTVTDGVVTELREMYSP
ncbi:MAG TPA: hypothetical protein VII33_11280 [Nakamurella sp.]